MKAKLNLIVAALLGLTVLASADEGDKKKDKPAKKKAVGVMAADADKDGEITLAEFQAWGAAKKKPVAAEKSEALFKKRDKNGDGKLTKDELSGGGKKKAGGDAPKKDKKKKGDGEQ